MRMGFCAYSDNSRKPSIYLNIGISWSEDFASQLVILYHPGNSKNKPILENAYDDPLLDPL
jgi:hypothetical protein